MGECAMKRSLILVAAITAILVISSAVHAQDTYGGLHGKVLDQEGKPLEGATARAEELANHYLAEAKTKKKGEYSKAGLRQGSYKGMLIVNGKIVMTIGEK